MIDINLGDEVRDQITGFEGVVTGKVRYISGCDQLLVQPPVKDGDFKEAHWIDIDRCRVVNVGRFKPSEVSSADRPGGDMAAPVK